MKLYKPRTIVLPFAFFTLFFLLVFVSSLEDWSKRVAYAFILAVTYAISHFLYTIDLVEEAVILYQKNHAEEYPKAMNVWQKVSFDKINEQNHLGTMARYIYKIQASFSKIFTKS